MRCEKVLLQINEYIDGELNEFDSRRIEAHLDSCSACSGELKKYRRTKELVAFFGTVSAPAGLLDAIHLGIEKELVIRPLPVRNSYYLKIAAAFAIVLLTAALAVSGARRLGEHNPNAAAALASLAPGAHNKTAANTAEKQAAEEDAAASDDNSDNAGSTKLADLPARPVSFDTSASETDEDADASDSDIQTDGDTDSSERAEVESPVENAKVVADVQNAISEREKGLKARPASSIVIRRGAHKAMHHDFIDLSQLSLSHKKATTGVLADLNADAPRVQGAAFFMGSVRKSKKNALRDGLTPDLHLKNPMRDKTRTFRLDASENSPAYKSFISSLDASRANPKYRYKRNRNSAVSYKVDNVGKAVELCASEVKSFGRGLTYEIKGDKITIHGDAAAIADFKAKSLSAFSNRDAKTGSASTTKAVAAQSESSQKASPAMSAPSAGQPAAAVQAASAVQGSEKSAAREAKAIPSSAAATGGASSKAALEISFTQSK